MLLTYILTYKFEHSLLVIQKSTLTGQYVDMFIGEFLPLADPSSLNLALSTLARVGESRMEGGPLGVSTYMTH